MNTSNETTNNPVMPAIVSFCSKTKDTGSSSNEHVEKKFLDNNFFGKEIHLSSGHSFDYRVYPLLEIVKYRKHLPNVSMSIGFAPAADNNIIPQPWGDCCELDDLYPEVFSLAYYALQEYDEAVSLSMNSSIDLDQIDQIVRPEVVALIDSLIIPGLIDVTNS
jgi:hypothetical protein